MVDIWADEIDGVWFAVAFHEHYLVATTVGPTYGEVVAAIMRDLPPRVPRRMLEEANGFARDTIRMLSELESGDERHKSFVLSEEYLPAPRRATLLTAAAIPIGYVTTYGDIGAVSGVIARSVGRAMATNPLYPVVPCHRVVGADMSLVGYGGRQDYPALRAKLDRLTAEARALRPTELSVAGGNLALYPVERVISKARRELVDPACQLPLFR